MKILTNKNFAFAISLILFGLARYLSSEVFADIYKANQPNFLGLTTDQIDVINRFAIIILVSMIHYLYSVYQGVLIFLKPNYEIKDYQTVLMILNSFVLVLFSEWFKQQF